MSYNLTTDFDAAVVAQQTGKLDLGIFVDLGKTQPIPQDKLPVLVTVCPADFGAILLAQMELVKAAAMAAGIAQGKASGGGANGEIAVKIGKKGGISLYGLTAQWPLTLYVEQIERLDAQGWLKIGPKMRAFIDSNPTEIHPMESYRGKVDKKTGELKGGSEADKAYLVEIIAGKVPHAKVVGDKVHVRLSRKS